MIIVFVSLFFQGGQTWRTGKIEFLTGVLSSQAPCEVGESSYLVSGQPMSLMPDLKFELRCPCPLCLLCIGSHAEEWRLFAAAGTVCWQLFFQALDVGSPILSILTATGAVITKWLQPHPTAARQLLKAPRRKGTFTPYPQESLETCY